MTKVFQHPGSVCGKKENWGIFKEMVRETRKVAEWIGVVCRCAIAYEFRKKRVFCTVFG